MDVLLLFFVWVVKIAIMDNSNTRALLSEAADDLTSVSEGGKRGGPPEMPALNIPPQPPAGLPVNFVRDQDVEHIRMLSICYYINAGLTALFACFPIIHLVMGVAMLSGSFGGASVPAHEREMMQIMGGMFVGVSTAIILTGWLLAVLNFLVARKIVRRESRMFCLVVAGVNCLNVPLGTVLGVFTFVVLGRPQVVQSFEHHGDVE